MAFHFDTNGNVIVDSWQTSESKEFSKQELAESYVMASREDIMEKDPKAKETLNSYLNKTVNDNMRIFSVIEKEKIDSDNHEEHEEKNIYGSLLRRAPRGRSEAVVTFNSSDPRPVPLTSPRTGLVSSWPKKPRTVGGGYLSSQDVTDVSQREMHEARGS